MGDYAASGGYYISCGADYIFAEPTTLTGSIGIFGTIPNVSKLRNKVGLDIDGVSTNKHSDMGTNMIYKGMNAEEHAIMQTMIPIAMNSVLLMSWTCSRSILSVRSPKSVLCMDHK